MTASSELNWKTVQIACSFFSILNGVIRRNPCARLKYEIESFSRQSDKAVRFQPSTAPINRKKRSTDALTWLSWPTQLNSAGRMFLPSSINWIRHGKLYIGKIIESYCVALQRRLILRKKWLWIGTERAKEIYSEPISAWIVQCALCT